MKNTIWVAYNILMACTLANISKAGKRWNENEMYVCMPVCMYLSGFKGYNSSLANAAFEVLSMIFGNE